MVGSQTVLTPSSYFCPTYVIGCIVSNLRDKEAIDVLLIVTSNFRVLEALIFKMRLSEILTWEYQKLFTIE